MDTLKVYKSGKDYVGKIDTSKIKSTYQTKDIKFIVILDVSGSMDDSVPLFVNIILPNILEKLDIKDDINLITFSNKSDLYTGSIDFFRNLNLEAEGCTYMKHSIDQLEKILSGIDEKKNIRILAVSDGELFDQSETIQKASDLYTKFKDKFTVNSQAVRLYTSSSEPETKGMSSLMQFNNVTESTLIDISAKLDPSIIAEKICSLFQSDGLGWNIYIKSNEKIFLENPWSEASNELKLIIGENIFWLNKIPEKVDIVSNEQISNLKIEICENITIKNYQNILENKIKYFYQKLKVLKVVNTEDASKEINKIINYFENFEDILNLENIDKEENLKEADKFKISNRAYTLKKLIEKRNISIANKMKEIQNNDKVSQLNAKQLADFLRNLDINKDSKSLAKRGIKEGIDFDVEARKEVLNMLNNIKELDGIDDTNHTVSFYSTSTTLSGIKSLCELAKDKSVLDNITAIDIIKLLNIVGVGCSAPVSDYPDPITYSLTDIYIGCYISLSDVLTASEFNGGKDNLVDFNTKKIITNVIPFYDDIRIHKFLLKYAPKLLEYTASIGMRRLLLEIPCTYEFLIESGVWKFSEILNTNRSQAAINVYCKLIQDYEIVSKGHYDHLIKIALEQAKFYKEHPLDEKNNYHIFLDNKVVINMIYVFLNLIKINENEILQKICRELFCHSIHKAVNKLIKRNNTNSDFIKQYLEDLLGINYDKYGNDLPALFEENKNVQFYNNYEININKLNDFYKSSFRSFFIPFSSYYLKAALEEDKIKAFANLPEFNEDNIIKAFGINFDMNHFKLFTLVQGFLSKYYEKSVDKDEKIIQDIDTGIYNLSEKMVKDYVQKMYKQNYEERLGLQKKTEYDMLETELIEKMKSADMDEFVTLIKDGIKRGNTECKINSISNSSFIKLKNQIINNHTEFNLVNMKIAVISTGMYKEEKVFNNGNIYRSFMDFKEIVCKTDEDYWNKMYKYISKKRRHIYRALDNRQGHSNDKPSYWALGYNTIEEMLNTISKDEIEEYKKIHANCCGLGLKRKRTYRNKNNEHNFDEGRGGHGRSGGRGRGRGRGNCRGNNLGRGRGGRGCQMGRGSRGGRGRGRGRGGFMINDEAEVDNENNENDDNDQGNNNERKSDNNNDSNSN